MLATIFFHVLLTVLHIQLQLKQVVFLFVARRLERLTVLLKNLQKLLYFIKHVDPYAPIETCCFQDPHVLPSVMSSWNRILRRLNPVSVRKF